MRRLSSIAPPADESKIINDSETLNGLCESLENEPFICVDTEFIREKTFWPILCLVQIADSDGKAHAIDTLAEGIDFGALSWLLNEASPVKVFHACRQDVEIFFQHTKRVPTPLYDTQVAAMALGFGDSVSYENLVQDLTGIQVDKTDRYSDWSKRPLTEAQFRYALGDVLHLPQVYRRLVEDLEKEGKTSWIEEEMDPLRDKDIYTLDPADAWKRAKIPNLPSRAQAVAHALATAREEIARDCDRPKRWILRDDVMIQIARTAPENREELASVHGISEKFADGRMGERILKAVKEGSEASPPPRQKKPRRPSSSPVGDLLRALLRHCAVKHNISPRMLASATDLDRMAAGAVDVPAFDGWRHEVFGKHAKDLCEGRIGLAAKKKHLEMIPLSEEETKENQEKRQT